MRALIDRVRQFSREHDLMRPETRVLAAVSGGSDSMALARILAELHRAGDLRLAGVVHFNHQLRPQAADDEEFVRAASESLGIADLPFTAGRDDVAARADREGRSIEDAARSSRHAFFEHARRDLRADVVALGHTRDDQAETVLLRLVRGAGPRGLSGMYPRNGALVRPLLDCTRAELRAWLGESGVHGHVYVEDATNTDVSIPRNRVRAELIPLLAARFNPAIVDVLADEAALARELWQWMEEASAPLLSTPGVLDGAALRAAPPALRRLVVWRAMTAASGGRHISFDHVASAVRLILSDRPDASLDMPGHTVHRNGDRIVLTERRGETTPVNFFERPLSIPGEAAIPEAGCVISAALGDKGSAAVRSGPVAHVRRDLIKESLVVRNRRPGDKFRPVGLNGSKKLQDLFVDAKLPRRERDAVPVVVDDRDRIVWVAGYGIDEAFRVTDASQAVLVLRLTRS